jgi:hypothetical protein
MALLTSCHRKSETQLFQVIFGISEINYVTGRRASDFIDNPETIGPKAIAGCKGKFIGFGDMTDGGAAALFQVNEDAGEALACIKRQLPRGHVVRVEANA